MAGNTTRANKTLRRNIHLSTRRSRPVPVKPTNTPCPHNPSSPSSPLNSRQFIPRDITRTGLRSLYRRATSSLCRIWVRRWDTVRAWNTSTSTRPSHLNLCHNFARRVYSNCARNGCAGGNAASIPTYLTSFNAKAISPRTSLPHRRREHRLRHGSRKWINRNRL